MKPKYKPSKKYQEELDNRLRQKSILRLEPKLRFIEKELKKYQIIASYLFSPEKHNKEAAQGLVDFVEIKFTKNISPEAWKANTNRIIDFLEAERKKIQQAIIRRDAPFEQTEEGISKYIKQWKSRTVTLGDWLTFKDVDVFRELEKSNLSKEEWDLIIKHQDGLYNEVVKNIFEGRLLYRLETFKKNPETLEQLIQKDLELIKDLYNGNINEINAKFIERTFGIWDPHKFRTKAEQVLTKNYLHYQVHNIHHSDCLHYVEALLKYKDALETELKKMKPKKEGTLAPSKVNLHVNASPNQISYLYQGLTRIELINETFTSLEDFRGVFTSYNLLKGEKHKIHWPKHLDALAFLFSNLPNEIFNNHTYQSQIEKSQCFVKRHKGRGDWVLITAQAIARAANQAKKANKKFPELRKIINNIPKE